MKETYILFDFGLELDQLLKIFQNSINYISAIISKNREKIFNKITNKIEDIPKLTDNGNYKIVLGNIRNLNNDKLMLQSNYNIPHEKIITIHEFLINLIDNCEDLLIKPNWLRLEACTLCNLNCVDCYMRKDDSGTVGKGYLKFNDFKQFIEKNNFIEYIELSNSGEVFLNPELISIIRLAKDNNITIGMTNGVNLNSVKDEILEEIVKLGNVNAITISLDGATPEIYTQYRRNGNLLKVITNIAKINYYKNIYNKKTPFLYWQFILFDFNQHEAEMAKKLAASLEMKIFFKRDWCGGFKPENPEWLEKITGFKFTKQYSSNPSYLNDYTIDDICKQLYRTPQVNYDGRLLGCCTVYKSDWGINVFENDYLSAINSPDYKNAIKMILGAGPIANKNNPCGKCFLYNQFEKNKKVIF